MTQPYILFLFRPLLDGRKNKQTRIDFNSVPRKQINLVLLTSNHLENNFPAIWSGFSRVDLSRDRTSLGGTRTHVSSIFIDDHCAGMLVRGVGTHCRAVRREIYALRRAVKRYIFALPLDASGHLFPQSHLHAGERFAACCGPHRVIFTIIIKRTFLSSPSRASLVLRPPGGLQAPCVSFISGCR